MDDITKEEWDLFLELERRDALAEITDQISTLQHWKSKISFLESRIEHLKEKIQGNWDNYIDGTKIFEERYEYKTVRRCLERLNLINKNG